MSNPTPTTKPCWVSAEIARMNRIEHQGKTYQKRTADNARFMVNVIGQRLSALRILRMRCHSQKDLAIVAKEEAQWKEWGAWMYAIAQY